VVQGDVELTIEGASLAAPLVQTQRLRALAITGTERIPLMQEVPTFEETRDRRHRNGCGSAR